MTNAIIWTKNQSQDCVKAVLLAKRMGLTVEVRNIDSNQWNLAALQAAIPGATTLPQIVVGDTVIGGFADLVAKNKEQQAAAPKVSLKTKEEYVAATKSKIQSSNTAKLAAKSDKKQAAIQAAMEGTTREQRHAARDEAIANTKTYREAQRAAPRMTPDGYIQCAPVNAPAEHHQARFNASKAARPARIAEKKAAGAEARAARIAAKNERVAAAKAARLQRVGVA
jgi:glutaredoxin